MAKMKEQNKTPKKELNKMEISNVSDKEFKILVFRMFNQLNGYLNSIKTTQPEIKVTLNEIKKNWQAINSRVDEAKNQINELEQKEEKKFSQNSKKKKESKKTKID